MNLTIIVLLLLFILPIHSVILQSVADCVFNILFRWSMSTWTVFHVDMFSHPKLLSAWFTTRWHCVHKKRSSGPESSSPTCCPNPVICSVIAVDWRYYLLIAPDWSSSLFEDQKPPRFFVRTDHADKPQVNLNKANCPPCAAVILCTSNRRV